MVASLGYRSWFISSATAPSGDETLIPDDAVDVLEELLPSTKQVVRVGPQVEIAAARRGGCSFQRLTARQIPAQSFNQVSAASGAPTDVAGHCTSSQESGGESTSSS